MEGDSRVQPVYYHCCNDVNTTFRTSFEPEVIVTGPVKTIFEVEREQRWRIWLLFALLLAVVFAGVWLACLIVAVWSKVLFGTGSALAPVFDPRNVVLILAIAALVSLIYWYTSRIDAPRRLLTAMHGMPLDPADRYHQRLTNIVEEVRIATGGPRIECVTVPTLGMNAFAFSDLHGGGVVGVTEGALSRLSRPQLQAVVAHEFAHILSGTYVTATVSCLLFGIYSSLGEKLEEAALATGKTRAAPVALGALSLRGLLFVLQLASRVTSAALSRQRELEADLASARYTGDPLSLAQALRLIGRHPGGAGYIPEGLAPLCIRANEGPAPWLFGRWQATHPPLGRRIDRLLALAHVSPDDFERQAEAAVERFNAREHVTKVPAAAPVGAAALAALQHGMATSLVPAAAQAGAASRAAASPQAATAAGVPACPSCGERLHPTDYEGVGLLACPGCGGRLAGIEEVARIVARREAAFTPEQERLADMIAAQGDDLRRAARLTRGRPGVRLIPCPRCGRPMLRRHWDYEHAVEVDLCAVCRVAWFEKDELEVLQLLGERRTP